MKQIQLVVCDMDGTLLNSHKVLTPRTVAAMEQARLQGVFVTICSGRVYPMLECYWRSAHIEGPIIAANGAHIVDCPSGRTLWEAPIDPEEALALMDFCAARGMDYSALCTDGCYFSPVSVRRERFVQYNRIAAQDGYPPIPLFTLEGEDANRIILGKRIHKLLVYRLLESDLPQAESFIRKHTSLAYTSSEGGLLDISAAGVSKGTGLIRLAELMRVPLAHTCAFGDFENDIPMFEAAGLSVAMANGSEAAKAAADLLTVSNDEDGVAVALEKYLLGGK